MIYHYTNIMDSVIYAGFKGHQYSVKTNELVNGNYDSSTTLASSVLKEKMEMLLKNIKENSSEGLIVTLNQICDNRFIWFEKQEIHFELLYDLIISRKLKISTYNDHDLISYTKKNLEDCLKRLCGGVISSELVYISSLFPMLGIDNSTTPTRRGIEILLGGYKPFVYESDDNCFLYKNERYNFNTILNTETSGSGLYKAFCKYEVQGKIEDSDCWFPDRFHLRNIKNWIEKLFKLNEYAKLNGAFISNVRNDFSLASVINFLLSESTLLGDKLSFWIGNMRYKSEVKEGIAWVMKKLTIYSKRSSMYLHVRDTMEEYAESILDAPFYNYFHTNYGKGVSYLPYQPVLYICLAIIDYSYNLLNALYAIESPVIIEYDFKCQRNLGTMLATDFRESRKTYNNISIERLKECL